MNETLEYVILVAGGKGLRMQAAMPKQFMLLGGKPVLMHSLEAFYTYSPAISIIVVLPQEQINYWQELCKTYNCTIAHKITAGGMERFYSVQAGLACIDSEGFVAVHDGVRPLVSPDCIARGFSCARRYGSAIPVVDSIDSLRIIDGKTSKSIDRSKVKQVQTPQIFNIQNLKQAYKQSYSSLFTDDASVWESAGFSLALYEGEKQNIKLTTPVDFAWGELFLSNTI
ncbi:MAG: 2-C-methyl-D-erythritol 4-phosphate cytidylyltransferase [Bacteroidales bacterium]|jgi:2-C-methyl-D-erythritol 4-phosphate cytidylyltransferase|nr:2-C-methyl-D-erythritol 4-phosphate cytidylyltransferase [Bacteroidales bacterium]